MTNTVSTKGRSVQGGILRPVHTTGNLLLNHGSNLNIPPHLVDVPPHPQNSLEASSSMSTRSGSNPPSSASHENQAAGAASQHGRAEKEKHENNRSPVRERTVSLDTECKIISITDEESPFSREARAQELALPLLARGGTFKQTASAPSDLWRLQSLQTREGLFRVESKRLLSTPRGGKRSVDSETWQHKVKYRAIASACEQNQKSSCTDPKNNRMSSSRADTLFLTALVATAALSSCIYGLVLAATNASVNFIHLDFETCGTQPAPPPPVNGTVVTRRHPHLNVGRSSSPDGRSVASRQLLTRLVEDRSGSSTPGEREWAASAQQKQPLEIHLYGAGGDLSVASSESESQLSTADPPVDHAEISRLAIIEDELVPAPVQVLHLQGIETHHIPSQTMQQLMDDSENVNFNCPRQTFIQQVSVAAVLLGAGTGSLLGGPFADRVGRRGSMLRLNAVAFFIFLSCAFATGWYTFIAARFFAGLAIGAVSVAVPMYIAEVCPDDLRGKFGVAHQLLITIGILMSDAMGLVQSQDIDFSLPLISRSQITHIDQYWWRIMVGASCLPALMSVVVWGLLLRKYESPVWLVRAGQKEDALTVMKSLMPGASGAKVQEAVSTIETLQTASGETKSFWWALQSRYYRVGAIIGCILSACQQTSGINVMITQSTTVFLQVANYKYATLLTTLTGVLNVVVTIATIPMIEKLGRRNLLLASAVGTTLSMGTCLVAIAFNLAVGILVPVMIMCFIMSFAIGWGPVVWIYLSDIYPAEIKGSCFAHAIMVNWFACAVVVFGIGNFLSNKLVTYSTFFVLNVFGLAFIMRYVVETKGSSVEDSPIYHGRERDFPVAADSSVGGTTTSAAAGDAGGVAVSQRRV